MSKKRDNLFYGKVKFGRLCDLMEETTRKSLIGNVWKTNVEQIDKRFVYKT